MDPSSPSVDPLSSPSLRFQRQPLLTARLPNSTSSSRLPSPVPPDVNHIPPTTKQGPIPNSPAMPDKSNNSEFKSLSRRDLEVVNARYDEMTDEELDQAMAVSSISQPFDNGASSSIVTPRPITRRLDTSKSDVVLRSSASTGQTSPTGNEPLFPPSPPSGSTVLEHPLRILSRAVRELREEVDKLRAENASLKVAVAKSLPLAVSSATPRRTQVSLAYFSAFG
jgi:hypothetical protein